MDDLTNTTYRRIAVVLIVIGVVFGIDNTLLDEPLLYRFWPLVLVLPGSGFIGIFAKHRGKGDMYLAVGVYLLCFAALAQFCSLTTWAHLRSLWPLFIGFLGLAILVLSCFHHERRLQHFVALLLLSLAAFFILLFNVGAWLWWTSFVLVGLCILLARKLA